MHAFNKPLSSLYKSWFWPVEIRLKFGEDHFFDERYSPSQSYKFIRFLEIEDFNVIDERSEKKFRGKIMITADQELDLTQRSNRICLLKLWMTLGKKGWT